MIDESISFEEQINVLKEINFIYVLEYGILL